MKRRHQPRVRHLPVFTFSHCLLNTPTAYYYLPRHCCDIDYAGWVVRVRATFADHGADTTRHTMTRESSRECLIRDAEYAQITLSRVTENTENTSPLRFHADYAIWPLKRRYAGYTSFSRHTTNTIFISYIVYAAMRRHITREGHAGYASYATPLMDTAAEYAANIRAAIRWLE